MRSGQSSKIFKSEIGDLVRNPVGAIKEILHLSLLPILYVQGYSGSRFIRKGQNDANDF